MFNLDEIEPFAEGIIYDDASDEEINRVDFPQLKEIHFNSPDIDIFHNLKFFRVKFCYVLHS